MPSEKAKDNKALAAVCVACEKSFSPEVMVALSGRGEGGAKQYSVCIQCANGGWRPPEFIAIYNFRPQ